MVLDLRLSAVRGLVRAMARAAELPLIDLSGACAVSARTAGIALGLAAGMLRAASARAGEWHATDPDGGLAASIRFRLERSGRLPRLMSGARLADPPALVVPPGGPGAGRVGLADLAGAIPAGCALQSELLERAGPCGRLTVAEVALGHRAVLTAVRTVGLLAP